MKNIVLTGGGTAGHVTPNIALIPKLKELGYKISYIGSINGIEKELIKDLNIDYYSISTGKLRRYFDLKNVKDCFKVIKGIADSNKIIKEISPNIIFSKGGFVGVPVVISGKINKVPIILHESDITIGLANKICIPFSKKVCTNFPETLKNIPSKKGELTGTPLRKELFLGSKNKGLKICNFSNEKKIILIICGSLGSVKINNVIRSMLDSLLENYQIIHICGKNNLESSLEGKKGYYQVEYLKDELKDIFAASDIVISRAGANAISEILALKKLNILIPLSKNASRGDQILNANSFKSQGFSIVLQEESLNKENLLNSLNELNKNKNFYIKNMHNHNLDNSIDKIINLIKKYEK